MIAPLVLTYFVDAPSWDDCRGEAALLNLSLPGLLEAELVPEVTSLGLALALYSACLATVFGNTLVIVAVVKVGICHCAELNLGDLGLHPTHLQTISFKLWVYTELKRCI